MEEVFNSCPGTGEIEEKIRKDVTHEEFLFFRIAEGDELDWIFELKNGYEMYCTACRAYFFEERGRKHPASDYDKCPNCGHTITPRRWKDRKCLNGIKFAYHIFQKANGTSTDVWFRSFQVTCNRDFEENDKYELFEYARVLFSEDGAKRWVRSRNWIEGVKPWKEVKFIRFKNWCPTLGIVRKNFFAGNIKEEIEGSCLKYSMAEEAFEKLHDPIEYLSLYLRYPACEYLWKMGLGRFLVEREQYYGNEFWKAVNLKAKKPDQLLRGLGKKELKIVKTDNHILIADLLKYRELKGKGVCKPDSESFQYVRGLRVAAANIDTLASQAHTTPLQLRRYHEKQAKRSGHSIIAIIADHRDYLRQLQEIGAENGDTLPNDLAAAHERLSARLRKTVDSKLNFWFRIRRRLLKQLKFRDGSLFIRSVDSVQEITKEGEMQRNCVAGYAKSHANGQTAIFVLRKKEKPSESWHTVELNPKTLNVIQCRGCRNSNAAPEASEFIRKWTGILKNRQETERRSI